MLLFVSTGISWFEQVATDVRDLSERGEGFFQAVVLLRPIRFIANFATVAAGGLILWNVFVLYRRSGRLRRALQASFAFPSRTIIYFAVATALLLVAAHLTFIMPTLQQMAASVAVPLPASARVVISVSSALQEWWWVAVVVGGPWALYARFRRRRVVR